MTISAEPSSVEWSAALKKKTGRPEAMRASAASGVVLRGSARAAVAALSLSRSRMPASSATATSRMSRPSSLLPIVSTRTRGEVSASLRK